MTEPLPHQSIAVVLGTRPEIVKLAGVVRELGSAARVVHTGQHYDANLSDVFFEEFGMQPPDVRIEIGGETRGTQIGLAVAALDAEFAANPPATVVVQGDTNTAVAGALAANAGNIPLAHVEAGLRSFDRRMPEEHNRIVADHLADLCLAPTAVAAANLRNEGVPDERIEVTGNTVIEAVARLLPSREARREILARHGLASSQYVLATFHRPENVDEPGRLEEILRQLGGLPVPVLLPIHPRTVARVTEFGLDPLLDEVITTEPIGYRDFLALGAESALLISDSGGVQEEVSAYKRPVVVVRRSTERPEVVGSFAELVEPGPAIGEVAERWLNNLTAVHSGLATLPSPYGDETAPRRSAAVITELARG